MFSLQYAILKRGLEMLKEDGILVYSTCSFNPVENEAVVQRAVIELGCTIVAVDKIENMVMRNGFTTWNPLVEKDENNTWLFPIEENIWLQNCIRILPQDNNTGGFFLAVLKKQVKVKNTYDGVSSAENVIPEPTHIENVSITKLKPFYISYNKVDRFFDISKEIETIITGQFDIYNDYKMITQSETSNTISLITNELYEIMKSTTALNIISGGCKSFTVNGHKGQDTTSYRAKVGILNKLNYNHEKVIILQESDAYQFLDNENVTNEQLSFSFKTPGISVVMFEGVNEYFCVWVGKNTSNLLCDKFHKKALKSLIKKI